MPPGGVITMNPKRRHLCTYNHYLKSMYANCLPLNALKSTLFGGIGLVFGSLGIEATDDLFG